MIYKDRASILADIKKHCYNISAVIDKDKQGKILVKINDDNPREIEVIDMNGMFCILIRYEKNKPVDMDTKNKGISTSDDGSWQGMSLSPRSKAYVGFSNFYHSIKGGVS